MASRQGHDVREARDQHPDPGDEELLAQAFAETRVLVTLDQDFGALVFSRAARHCGLVRLPDVPAAQRIAIFEYLLAAHERDLSEGAVLTVRGGRVRVSRQIAPPEH